MRGNLKITQLNSFSLQAGKSGVVEIKSLGAQLLDGLRMVSGETIHFSVFIVFLKGSVSWLVKSGHSWERKGARTQ